MRREKGGKKKMDERQEEMEKEGGELEEMTEEITEDRGGYRTERRKDRVEKGRLTSY